MRTMKHERTGQILQQIACEFSERFAILLSICESPIEELFLISMIKYYYQQSVIFYKYEFLVRSITHDITDSWNYEQSDVGGIFCTIYGIRFKMGNLTVSILPQHEAKGYRLDFAIIVNVKSREVKFNIECDGHDYHKSKEQRNSDSRREKELALEGWIPLRYTGSQLNSWEERDADFLDFILRRIGDIDKDL